MCARRTWTYAERRFYYFLYNLKNKTVLNELISRLENMEYGYIVNMEERTACMEQ